MPMASLVAAEGQEEFSLLARFAASDTPLLILDRATFTSCLSHTKTMIEFIKREYHSNNPTKTADFKETFLGTNIVYLHMQDATKKYSTTRLWVTFEIKPKPEPRPKKEEMFHANVSADVYPYGNAFSLLGSDLLAGG